MRIDLPCCSFKNSKYQFDGNCMDKGRYEKCEYIELALNDLPSAQRKGKWIWRNREVNRYRKETGTTEYGEVITIMVHDNYLQKINYCPVCGKRGDDTFMNYCPNCGEDMREGGNDEKQ